MGFARLWRPVGFDVLRAPGLSEGPLDGVPGCLGESFDEKPVTGVSSDPG